MRAIQRTPQFKRDVKRMEKRGRTFDEFKRLITKIATGEALDPRYRDHALAGQYKGTRECHIEPDWLLIYEVDVDAVILIRTGTHSDLFD